jgi:RNA polymerase sigma-70 factor (ECF subfamily)
MLRPQVDFTNLSRISDEALMKAISRRQPRALNEFFSRHGHRIKSVIGSVVHEEGDADDVLQEILIQIWRDSGRYSPGTGKLLGWVVTLARRRAIDRLRRKQAYCRAKERYEAYLDKEPDTAIAPTLFDEISRADMRRYLQRRLKNLPRNQRRAIELSFFKGLSHREIAGITRAPLGTVKTRLELGLQKLTHSLRPIRYKIS